MKDIFSQIVVKLNSFLDQCRGQYTALRTEQESESAAAPCLGLSRLKELDAANSALSLLLNKLRMKLCSTPALLSSFLKGLSNGDGNEIASLEPADPLLPTELWMLMCICGVPKLRNQVVNLFAAKSINRIMTENVVKLSVDSFGDPLQVIFTPMLSLAQLE